MSAYNPPTQNQSIFNPNNYGSSINTLADSAYDEITATLGNFTTLFIGTDNVATTLNTKQDTITGDTQFDSFNVLSNINFLEDGNVGSAYFPLSYTTISSISAQLTERKEFESRVYYAYPTYINGYNSYTWTQGTNSLNETLATWTFEYNLQSPEHYMEFDMTLEAPVVGSIVNTTPTILGVVLACSIGTNTNLSKVMSFTDTNSVQTHTDRFRTIMKLNSNTTGDYNGQMINGVSRGVVVFTLKIDSSTTNGNFTFKNSLYDNPASIRISPVRSGETIVQTPNVVI